MVNTTNYTGDNQRSLLQQIARQAMLDKGFLIDFPPEALQALNKLNELPIVISAPLQDMRSLNWCSIDNDDSEDLDQLSVAAALPEGQIKILVAIADVDAAVHKDSPFEEHARHNSATVYTPAAVFPMLPLKYSTDLTSMKAGHDRLSIVVEFIVMPDGTLKETSIYPAAVHNKAKLAYNATGAWLEGKGPVPAAIPLVTGLEQNLRLQQQAALELKTLRYQTGALNVETIQARAVFDQDKVTKLEEEHPNIAKDLIQEFMICANGIVAHFFSVNQIPSFRRVVRVPKRWNRIAELAATWDFSLPEKPDAKMLDQFLQYAKTKDPERFPDLSLSVVKLLGSGEYVVEIPGQDSAGHFGLAMKDYTHSTAPNRRYPDLITQRLLKAQLFKQPAPYTIEELSDRATHCTQMEDQANKVQRQVEKSAAALLLQKDIGRSFDAIVTGVSDKGTWVRIFHPPVEGKLVNGFEGKDVGERVRVQLTHTDVKLGFIDFKRI